jgi:hypothetical protein
MKAMKNPKTDTVPIITFSLLCLFFFTSVSYAEPNQRISSTFIQLYRSHHDWSHAQWETLFDEFERAQIKELIIQYGVYNNFAHFPTHDFETTDTPPLETILAIAEARGIMVLVGLNFDGDYWGLLWGDDFKLADFLNDSYVKSMLAANQIFKIAQHYESFKGWYISEEFEERTWNYYNRLDMIISYLGHLSHDLKLLTPDASVALSTYIHTPPPAQVYHDTMYQLLANTDITDLYFQDGIGTGFVPKDSLLSYIIELKNATLENDCDFHVVVELFDDRYLPASIDRVIWQIHVANQCQAKSICSFAVPHYMSQFGGPGAAGLLRDYLIWLESETLKDELMRMKKSF